MNKKEALEFKKEIEETKSRVSEARGRYSAIMEDLKKNWSLVSIKEAEKLKEDLIQEKEEIDEEIEERVKKLEENYDI